MREDRMTIRCGSEVHLDEWVSPLLADPQGFLQAGKILEWMDVTGVVAAARHCRLPVVTAAIEGMELHEPIPLGERVTMTARVAHTSSRSLGVSVGMTRGGPGGRAVLEAYLTFVPLDRRGRPGEVPRFWPQTPLEELRFREGELRREFRKQLQAAPRPTFTPPPADHRSHIHKIEPVRLATLNFHGTLYGGTLMRWSEDAANLSARAFVGGEAVRCIGLSGLTFLKPVQRDRFVHLRAVVVHATASTLTSLVTVESEDLIDGTVGENLRGFFSYAPLDAALPIPPLERHGADEQALFDEVEQRAALQRRIGEVVKRAA
jgi:acyl-CoA hydrolase